MAIATRLFKLLCARTACLSGREIPASLRHCKTLRGRMPFLALPFPRFDPIVIAIGPFAIRWYALAYIGGIVLGWLYARRIVRTERFWGGPAPISLLKLDDFI